MHSTKSRLVPICRLVFANNSATDNSLLSLAAFCSLMHPLKNTAHASVPAYSVNTTPFSSEVAGSPEVKLDGALTWLPLQKDRVASNMSNSVVCSGITASAYRPRIQRAGVVGKHARASQVFSVRHFWMRVNLQIQTVAVLSGPTGI